MHKLLLIIVSIFALSACVNTATSKNATRDKNWISQSATKQLQAMESGELSSEALVTEYLSQIERYDQKGPKIQAILSLNPNALAEAKEKDKQRQAGNAVGRLHGIPVIVKDNVETSELPTTAGSLALKNNNTNRDAPIVKRLKAEGAIIMGKTNLSEWANFRSNDSISGWSAIGGQTKNPHLADRTPCGSSSGSGAGVAAMMAPLAIGTETNGSIICPSAINGIVGVKPTVGLLSRRHIVPISVTQDTAGPMTRSVKDAALMLSVMAGSDDQDVATKQADKYAIDFTANLDASIKDKKIGVFKAVQSNHKEIIETFDEATKQLEELGAELVIIEEYQAPDEFWSNALQVLLIEFKHELNAYLDSLPESVQYRTLEALIEFNNKTDRQTALFDQSLFDQSQETNGYDQTYKDALAMIQDATRKNGIDKLLSENGVDAIVFPSQVPAFLIDTVYGDNFPGGTAGAGWMAAIAGYPHVSVPMGSMKGLPISLSFIGKKWDDALLLNLAYQYEQASKKLMTPTFSTNSASHPYFKARMAPFSE